MGYVQKQLKHGANGDARHFVVQRSEGERDDCQTKSVHSRGEVGMAYCMPYAEKRIDIPSPKSLYLGHISWIFRFAIMDKSNPAKRHPASKRYPTYPIPQDAVQLSIHRSTIIVFCGIRHGPSSASYSYSLLPSTPLKTYPPIDRRARFPKPRLEARGA